MSSVKVSNFDIPNQSKRFSMAKYSEFDPQNVIQRNNQDEIMRDSTVPVGIIDACRINKEYSIAVLAVLRVYMDRLIGSCHSLLLERWLQSCLNCA